MYSSAKVLNAQAAAVRESLVKATCPTQKRHLLAQLCRLEAQAIVAERDAFLEQKAQRRAANVATHMVLSGRVKHLFVTPDQEYRVRMSGKNL